MIIPIESIAKACNVMDGAEIIEGLTMAYPVALSPYGSASFAPGYTYIYFKCFGGRWNLIINEEIDPFLGVTNKVKIHENT